MGEGAGGHEGQDRTARPEPLTEVFYWLPTLRDAKPALNVVICHQLGHDAEVGHVEMWNAVID